MAASQHKEMPSKLHYSSLSLGYLKGYLINSRKVYEEFILFHRRPISIGKVSASHNLNNCLRDNPKGCMRFMQPSAGL
jgi:hypothetical protein